MKNLNKVFFISNKKMQRFTFSDGESEHPAKYFSRSDILKYLSQDVTDNEISYPLTNYTKEMFNVYVHLSYFPSLLDLITSLSIAHFLEDKGAIKRIESELRIWHLGLLVNNSALSLSKPTPEDIDTLWKDVKRSFCDCVKCSEYDYINKEVLCDCMIKLLNISPETINEKIWLEIKEMYSSLDQFYKDYIFENVNERIKKIL